MTVYSLVWGANAARTITKWIAAGADSAAEYVLMAADAALPNARTLTAGSGISITDGGAGGPVTISSAATTAPVWAYGDGSDGTVTFDGSTSVTGFSLAGSTYTQTRDVYFDTATLNVGIIIKRSGCRAFTKNTFTCNGHVHADGTAAGGGTPGVGGGWDIQNAPPGGGASLGGGRGGANGGEALSTISHSMGGAGGAGDSSGGPFGVTRPVAAVGSPHELIAAIRGYLSGPASASGGVVTASANLILVGGNGGGGGANAGGPNGSGGGGGGVLVECHRVLAGSGTITANGGAGATGSPNCGGGGGGGFVVWVARDTTGWTGAVTAAGGASGAAGLSVATAGSPGTVIAFTA